MRTSIVPATVEHADWIGFFARPEDEAELWASSRSHPTEVLLKGLASSTHVMTGLVDDEPACMFGVVPLSALTGVGSPWMVATPTVELVARDFIRASKPAVGAMRSQYSRLLNFVDARNDKAMRWLSWLGFTLHPAQPHGPDRIPFHLFEWRDPNV